jgi:hypothetical protein
MKEEEEEIIKEVEEEIFKEEEEIFKEGEEEEIIKEEGEEEERMKMIINIGRMRMKKPTIYLENKLINLHGNIDIRMMSDQLMKK